MVEDLADFYAGVDFYRLDAEHLQCPVAGEADVAEAGGGVDEQSQSADGAAAFEHGDVFFRLGEFHGSSEIETTAFQDESVVGNDDPLGGVRLFHVEYRVGIDKQFVVQGEVVAVGVELGIVKRVDKNFRTELAFDFETG